MSRYTEAIDGLLQAHCEGDQTLYAVVDGAQAPSIQPKIADALNKSCCLFSGNLPADLSAAAPWLVALEPGDALTEWLLDSGWGKSWVVFLTTSASFKKVRSHLRSLFRVRDERGRKLYFRWYDPRVLREYLPTCTPDELATVFGPLELFLAEDEVPNTLLEFRRGEVGVDEASVELDAGDPAPEASAAAAAPEPAPAAAEVGVARDVVLAALAAAGSLDECWHDATKPSSWEEAWSEAPAAAARAALLRAPADSTHHALLLALREVIEAQASEEALEELKGFRLGVLTLLRQSRTLSDLREGLRSFPLDDPHLSFAWLTSSLCSELDPSGRGWLLAAAEVLALGGRLRSFKLDLEAGNDEALPALTAQLTPWEERVAALDAEFAELATLRKGLQRLQRRLTIRRASAKLGASALQSLLMGLRQLRDPVEAHEQQAAEALRDALRALELRQVTT